MTFNLSDIGYKLWIRFGCKTKYIRKLHFEQQTALANAKRALEEAFTPQLKSMVSKLMICDKCGRYSE